MKQLYDVMNESILDNEDDVMDKMTHDIEGWDLVQQAAKKYSPLKKHTMEFDDDGYLWVTSDKAASIRFDFGKFRPEFLQNRKIRGTRNPDVREFKIWNFKGKLSDFIVPEDFNFKYVELRNCEIADMADLHMPNVVNIFTPGTKLDLDKLHPACAIDVDKQQIYDYVVKHTKGINDIRDSWGGEPNMVVINLQK